MMRSRTARIRAGGGAMAVVIALVVAACGSSSNNNSSPASTATPSSPPANNTSNGSSGSSSGSSASGAVVRTARGPDGTFLVGPSGRTLYLWVADSGGMSSCNGACAQAWPPLTTHGKPTASGGAMASDLGTTRRQDGTTQVTYRGHPVYYYAGDQAAGDTSGQGSPQFGARWWLVAPSGAQITRMASSGSSSSSSDGGTPAPSTSGGGTSSSSGGGGGGGGESWG